MLDDEIEINWLNVTSMRELLKLLELIPLSLTMRIDFSIDDNINLLIAFSKSKAKASFDSRFLSKASETLSEIVSIKYDLWDDVIVSTLKINACFFHLLYWMTKILMSLINWPRSTIHFDEYEDDFVDWARWIMCVIDSFNTTDRKRSLIISMMINLTFSVE